MRRVFGLGETVLDIVFKDGQPLTAKAGGSVLNALVSLARMGHDCHFISELGQDKVGGIITNFLNENKVGTGYLHQYAQGQSAVAMAFLNKDNDAEYEFYKNYPAERLTAPLPDFKPNDILLFGSSYAIAPAIRNQIVQIAKHAQECGCIIIYDPNFRKKHDENQAFFLNYLKENFAFADMVRGSNEDFDNIYSATASDQVFSDIKKNCSNLIYTASEHGIFLQAPKIKKHYAVESIKTLSTIGAGDNFNAGLIHGILQKKINKVDLQFLPEENWDFLIGCGIKCSAKVCQSLDNYVPIEFQV